MQLASLKNGFKPLTIAASLLVAEPIFVYADVDQFTDVTTVISSNRTAQYLREVNNVEEDQMIIKRRFDVLYESWLEKTFFLSSVHAIVEQDDFKGIVAMGQKAVPFILNALENEPSNLVWALNLIFKQKISKKPNLTITEACKLWIKALRF